MRRMLLISGIITQILSGGNFAIAFNPIEGCFTLPEAKRRIEAENRLQKFRFSSPFRPAVPLAEIQNVVRVFEETFGPEFARNGQNLKIVLDEAKTDFNAFANVDGNDRVIVLHSKAVAFQGNVNTDVVGLILCHELGHHLGGEPLVADRDMSAEGQADYYATSKCMRRLLRTPYFQDRAQAVDPTFQSYCGTFFVFGEVPECARGLQASATLAAITARINLIETPSMDHSENQKVHITNLKHPSLQCRLDTLRAGGLCRKSERIEMTKTAPNEGVCSVEDSSLFEIRPGCWYAPSPQLTSTLASGISF